MAELTKEEIFKHLTEEQKILATHYKTMYGTVVFKKTGDTYLVLHPCSKEVDRILEKNNG